MSCQLLSSALCARAVVLSPMGVGNYANRDHTRGGQHWYIGSCRSGYCTNEMDQSYRIFLLPNSMFHHIFLDIDGLLTARLTGFSPQLRYTLPQFNYKFSTRPLMKGHFFAIIQTATIHFQDWHTLLANLKGICSKTTLTLVIFSYSENIFLATGEYSTKVKEINFMAALNRAIHLKHRHTLFTYVD